MVLINELHGDVQLHSNSLNGDVLLSDPLEVNGQIRSGLGISARWGNIEGEIEDQSDLKQILNAKADLSDIPEIPENLSDFNNDTGFITNANIPSKTSDLVNDSGFITSSDVPTKTSELQNDSGFITDAGVTSFNGSTGAVTYTAPVTSVNGSTGAVTISVPSKTSDLDNDSGYITEIGSSDVTDALGFTPYDSENPNGYTSDSALSTDDIDEVCV